MIPPEPITIAELLAAMEAASGPPTTGEGCTVRELQAFSGHTRQTICVMLRAGIEAGRIRAIRKRIRGIDNVLRAVPAYLLIPPQSSDAPPAS